MLLTSLIRLIIGYVTFSAAGELPERFLNQMQKKGIHPYSVVRCGENKFIISVKRSDFQKLPPLADAVSVEICIIEKRGLPFLIYRYRHRIGLPVGAVLFLIAVYFMSSRIWTITVLGNGEISKAEIISALNTAGLSVGSKISKLNLRSIREQARLSLDNVSYLELNISGTNAIVSVAAENKAPDISEKSPCNLVAERDGVIEKMEVESGIPAVTVGQTVLKGQLLVSGIENSTSQGMFLHTAKARVLASYPKSISVSVPFEKTVYSRTGGKFTKITLNFFNFSFKFPFWGGKEYAFYDKINKIKVLRLSGKEMPVSITQTVCYEKIRKTETLSDEECKQAALMMLEAAEESEFADMSVKARSVNITKTDNGYTAVGSYTVISDITKESAIAFEN